MGRRAHVPATGAVRVCECVTASEYPARPADKQVKRLASQESVCVSKGETPERFGYQRHQGGPGQLLQRS